MNKAACIILALVCLLVLVAVIADKRKEGFMFLQEVTQKYSSHQSNTLLRIALARIAQARGMIVSDKSIELQGYDYVILGGHSWHRWKVKVCMLQPPDDQAVCMILRFRMMEEPGFKPPTQWTIAMERSPQMLGGNYPSEKVLLAKGMQEGKSTLQPSPLPPYFDPEKGCDRMQEVMKSAVQQY